MYEDDEEEFHDTGTTILGPARWVPNCECGWKGDETPLAEHALEQARVHREEMGYEG